MKDYLLFWPEKWSFFFWSTPKVGQKKWLNFGLDLFLFFFRDHQNLAGKTVSILVKTFFFWDHLILTEKPPQFGSRLMKIWVKFVYCCFHLSKKPPPLLRNPGYAPGIFNVLIFCHLIASEANCLMMHKSFLAITTFWLEETVTYMLKSEDFFEFLSTEFAASLKLPIRDKSS